MKTFSLKVLLPVPLGVARDVEFRLEMGYKDEIQVCPIVMIVVQLCIEAVLVCKFSSLSHWWNNEQFQNWTKLREGDGLNI